MSKSNERYRIDVRLYKDRKALESGQWSQGCESVFKNLTLKEAQTCLSKMSNGNVLGMIRQNIIVREEINNYG